MPNNKLFSQPLGTKFLDNTSGVIYEIIEVNDDRVEACGTKRARAVDSGDRGAYVLGSWYESEVEIVVEGDNRDLYEKVEALPVGAVFQVERGTPWLRTETGVHDLLIAAHYPTSPINKPNEIPESWRGERYDVTVLFEDEEH
jgi:hypothetical protein